ncbi:hypothetical protein D3C71_1710150 [compost metagenome]
MQAKPVCDGQVVDRKVERLVSCAVGLDPFAHSAALHVPRTRLLHHKARKPLWRQLVVEVHGAWPLGKVKAVEQVVLGNVGAYHPPLYAPRSLRAAPVDIYFGRHAADDRAVGPGRSAQYCAPKMHTVGAVVVDVLRVVAARINTVSADHDGPATGMHQRCAADLIEPRPDAVRVTGWV